MRPPETLLLYSLPAQSSQHALHTPNSSFVLRRLHKNLNLPQQSKHRKAPPSTDNMYAAFAEVKYAVHTSNCTA